MDKFKQFLVKKKNRIHETRGFIEMHYLYRFPNGYGASVLAPCFVSNELWEIAVITWENDDKYLLCYDTPITSDVIRCCTIIEVNKFLEEIKNLPPIKNVKSNDA